MVINDSLPLNKKRINRSRSERIKRYNKLREIKIKSDNNLSKKFEKIKDEKKELNDRLDSLLRVNERLRILLQSYRQRIARNEEWFANLDRALLAIGM